MIFNTIVTNITQNFDLLKKAVLGGSHPQVQLLVIIFIMLWYFLTLSLLGHYSKNRPFVLL